MHANAPLRGGSEGGREDWSPWRSIGDASWLGAAGVGGPMAAAAADAEECAERFVGLLPGGGGRPLCDILQWELGLDQKRKVVDWCWLMSVKPNNHS